MTKPNSLSKLYKAMYYPICNFLETTVGHKSSFVWRSMSKSKFILKRSM